MEKSECAGSVTSHWTSTQKVSERPLGASQEAERESCWRGWRVLLGFCGWQGGEKWEMRLENVVGPDIQGPSWPQDAQRVSSAQGHGRAGTTGPL